MCTVTNKEQDTDKVSLELDQLKKELRYKDEYIRELEMKLSEENKAAKAALPESYIKNLKRYEYLFSEVKRCIADWILFEKIKLEDVPRDIRLSDRLFYTMAARVGRGTSCNQYVVHLKTMCDDLLDPNSTPDLYPLHRTHLLFHFFNNLRAFDPSYEMNEEYIEFRKSIPISLLKEIHPKWSFTDIHSFRDHGFDFDRQSHQIEV